MCRCLFLNKCRPLITASGTENKENIFHCEKNNCVTCMNCQCVLISLYHLCFELNCSKYIFLIEEKWMIYLAALNTYIPFWCSLIFLNECLDNAFYQITGLKLSTLIPFSILQTKAIH